MNNSRNVKLSKLVFYILVAILPINLGLHFILPQSYVGGLLVDYLVPTIFAQDILASILVVVWISEQRGKFINKLLASNFNLEIFLLFTLLLSTLLAPSFVISFSVFMRWFLYCLVSLYVRHEFDFAYDFKVVSKILCVWLVFLGLLAIGQYIRQGAVFNNYLILGEQPYTSATPLISRENVFGEFKVPAYGLFRHPNAFGGFLVILLTWVLYAFKTKGLGLKIFLAGFSLGFVALILTLSYFAWLAFLFGLLLLFSENLVRVQRVFLSLVLFIFVFSFLIHKVNFPQKFLDNPSLAKRVELIKSGYSINTSKKYLFGVGINSVSQVIEKYSEPTKYLRFVQPPHNVFILLLAEVGLVGVVLFAALFLRSLANSRKYSYIVFVLLLQTLILAGYDHYLLTIQQNFLLFWVVVGLAGKKIV